MLSEISDFLLSLLSPPFAVFRAMAAMCMVVAVGMVTDRVYRKVSVTILSMLIAFAISLVIVLMSLSITTLMPNA